MTKRSTQKHACVLAIAPSTPGFGFAVLEDSQTLVDWGVKTVKGDKNAGCVEKAKEMIRLYEPDQLVLQDYEAEGSRRSERIRNLGKQLAALAALRKVRLVRYSRAQILQAILGDPNGTKHALAQALANRFPEELGHRLPPKRRAWMSEDYRMAIFDAVALACLGSAQHPPRVIK
jgi:hypothetical protein